MPRTERVAPVRSQSGDPSTAVFTDLLYRVLVAEPEERTRLLEVCEDRATSDRVRRLLAREQDLGNFLDPPRAGGSAADRLLRRLAFADPRSGELVATPEPGLEKIRPRLERLGKIAGLIFAVATTVFFSWGILDSETFLSGPWKRIGATLLVLTGTSLGLRLLLRRLPATGGWILTYGNLYLVAVSGLTAYFHATHEFHRYGQASPFGPFLFPIVLLPLVLSTGARETLKRGVPLALAAFVGFFAAVLPAPLDPVIGLELAIVLATGLFIAMLLASDASRLRAEVAEVRRLGSYRLKEKIGQGGMGEVWRASHRFLARPAAVKLVRPVHLSAMEQQRETVLERFLREARATAALGSNHTVRIFDFGISDGGSFYLAMELLEGIDLQSLVSRFGPQPAGRVRDILLQVCDSLAEAHDMGLIHRDVKPGNIMLCRQGRDVDVAKVLDFGIVSLAGEPTDGGLTGTGALLGTPAFAAPEILGDRPADPRSDLYSLGCVAYWLLTGRRVFEHRSQPQQIAAQLRDEPPPLSAHGVAVPADLEAVVMDCLAKDPARRPGSAQQLAARLRACVPREWTAERAQDWWTKHLPEATTASGEVLEEP